MSTATASLNERLTPRDKPLEVGDRAPDFTLPDQDRHDVTLSNLLRQGKTVVLSFFPMAFTSVCQTEMNCYTKQLEDFKAKGALVYGVSCDSFATLKAWAEKEGLSVPMLADMHRKVCKAYGFYFPDLNTAARGTVVIGPDGLIKWVSARQLKEAVKCDLVLAEVGA